VRTLYCVLRGRHLFRELCSVPSLGWRSVDSPRPVLPTNLSAATKPHHRIRYSVHHLYYPKTGWSEASIRDDRRSSGDRNELHRRRLFHVQWGMNAEAAD
jgi:hypothetical protein